MLDYTLANQPGYAFVENEISNIILSLLTLREELRALPILQTPVSISMTEPVILAIAPETEEAYQADRAAIERAGFEMTSRGPAIVYPNTQDETILLHYKHPLYSFQFSVHCRSAKFGPIA